MVCAKLKELNEQSEDRANSLIFITLYFPNQKKDRPLSPRKILRCGVDEQGLNERREEDNESYMQMQIILIRIDARFLFTMLSD